MMHFPTLQSSSLFQRWHSLLTNHLLPWLKTGPHAEHHGSHPKGFTFSLAFNSIFKEKEDKPFTFVVVYLSRQLNITGMLTHSPARPDGSELGKKQSLTTSPRAAVPGQISPGLLAVSSTFNCKDKVPQKTEFVWLALRKALHVPEDELYLASKAATWDSPLLWQHSLFHTLHCSSMLVRNHLPCI